MFNFDVPSPNIAFFLLIIWEAFWKAIALWKSAKRGDLKWFVAIFLINFFGLIPLFYLWRTKQLEEVLRDIFKINFRKK